MWGNSHSHLKSVLGGAQPSYSAHPHQPLLPLDKLEQVSQLHLKAEPVQKEAELGEGSGSRLVSDSYQSSHSRQNILED